MIEDWVKMIDASVQTKLDKLKLEMKGLNMSLNAAEISAIFKDKIANFEGTSDVAEVGTVLSVGDGVARVYGLDNVQAGEMVEFPAVSRIWH